MQATMDTPTTPHTPLPQPSQPTSQTINTPTPNSFLPSSLYSVGSHTPASQATFTVPTISPADWYRLNQFTPLFHTMPFQPTPPPAQPDLTVQQPKRRGRPRKIRPSEPPAHTTSTATPNYELGSDEPAPLHDIAGKCWFVPHDDGRSDMDLVALWCSDFDNFTEWRTRPKHHAGEKLSAFIVRQGHPKREGRECEKKVSKWPGQDFIIMSGNVLQTDGHIPLY